MRRVVPILLFLACLVLVCLCVQSIQEGIREAEDLPLIELLGE